MTQEDRQLIKQWSERSNQALQDAETLLQTGSLNASVNRLYYACFYRVKAISIPINKKAHTHTGLKTIFNQHFIKNGKVKTDWGKFYSLLFYERNMADYAEFTRPC